MIRKKVLSIGNNSATLLVQDTEANGALRVLRRVSVAGWSNEDVKMVEESYEMLRKARLRGFVPIHTILMQNSFLSVVSSYAPEGDVSTFLEEEVDSPLDEQMVLRWLCSCALSIREMQTHKQFFPGLTTDRLFMDHQTGGTAHILLGVPLPLPVYIAQMQERRRNGVKVSLDYPPEVLAEPNWTFHETATDVWCLGRLGELLLTAKGTGLARRSGSTRQLLSRMMTPEPSKRPSMESVAQSLIALAGNVKLGQPVWPAETSNTTFSAILNSSPPPPPPSHPPLSAQASHHHSHLSASNNSLTSHPTSPATTSSPPEVPATRLYESRSKTETAGPVAVLASQSPAVSQHREPVSRPAYAPDDSWHRRAQHQFEQLQRLNASPPKLRGPGDGVRSPRGANVERRRSSAEAKSPSPRRGGRSGGVVDHNTRMLNEMFAEQEGLLRDTNSDRPPQRRTSQHAEDLQLLQAEAARQLRLETAQRQQEMRKHFTEWQRQNNQRYTGADNALVMEQDGVVIVAPRPAPLPGQPPSHATVTTTTTPASSAVASAQPSEKAGDGRSTPLTTATTSDDGPNEAGLAPSPTALTTVSRNAATRGSKPRPKTPQAASPVRRITSRPAVPSSSSRAGAPAAANAAAPGGLSAAAVPSHSNGSPRSPHGLQLSSVPPHVRRSNESNTRPTSSPTEDVSSGPTRRSSADTATLSAVEWSVDGIRSALRTLLRNRDLYGDVMQEVAVFVSQQEEARLSARANEIFMQRLRKLLPEDRLFYGAVPLCAQLVALEGLEQILRNVASTHPSR